MRHLVTVILVMLVLGAVVTGCEGARRYDSRLTAADSLMRSAPDSALAMVEAVVRDSLTDEADRAYRDLLLTQARYRCYITATSDSDINRALAWFRTHPSDREKLTRAYIYKGAVMEELGHPDSAMLYYKTAEATASPDDYFNLGYSNLRIGQLYQRLYYNDSAVVSRMRKAARFFGITGDTSYLITSIGTQGLFENVVGKDSAFHLLEKAISLGKEINASKRFFFQSKLAAYYFYDQNYQCAKDLSLDIVENGKDYCKEHQFYYYAARSYIKLNRIDSALRVKSMIPPPLDAVDSMNWHLLQSELAQATNDYRSYAYHIREADDIDKRIMKSSIETTIPSTELNFDIQQRETKREKEHIFNIILITVAFILIAALLISCSILLLRKINQRYETQLEEVQTELKKLIDETESKELAIESERNDYRQQLAEKNIELNNLKQLNDELEAKQENVTEQVSFIIQCRKRAFKQLFYDLRVKTFSNGSKKVMPLVGIFKEFSENKKIIHSTPKEPFWSNLKLSVDGEYNGIASFVEDKYPTLSVNEQHLFLLLCAGLSRQIIKICMDYANEVTVSNNKRRLMKKMGLDISFEEFIKQFSEGKTL